jgi:DNA modification methylase
MVISLAMSEVGSMRIKKPDRKTHTESGTPIEDVLARRELREEARLSELRRRAAGAPEVDPRFDVINDDCLAVLPTMSGKPRLAFADPPYNVGVDYGDGAHEDRLDDDEYVRRCAECFQRVYDILTPDGTFWLLVGYEYIDRLSCELTRVGFHRRAWITWYETFGVCNSRGTNFSRTSRPLLYCVKDRKNFVWNRDAVMRASDRQTKYDDARANPAGKVWDDVWLIPRLTGTCAERIPTFPTQLPLALLRPIIGATSDPGDLILDPYAGSGTTGVEAVRQGRRFVGIEKRQQFAELAMLRLRAEGMESSR